jgi:hypothetical protein
LTITGSPITGSGTINIAGAGTSSQVILGDLTLGTLTSGTVTSVSSSQAFISIASPTTTPSISIGNASASATGVLTSTDWNTFNNKGSGTVTSVALTETGTALSISGSPITGSGTFNISGTGTSSQVILGDLTLGTLTSGTVTGTGAANQVSYWTSTTAQAGSTGLTYDPSTGDLTVGGYVETGTKVTTPSGTNLELSPGGASSGSIVIADGANGTISITPNGTGTVKIDGVGIDNSAIATGYVLKATSTTEAGWAAESGGGGSSEWNVVNTQNNINSSYTRHVVSKSFPWGRISSGGTSSTGNIDDPTCRPFISPISGDVTEIGIVVTTADATGVSSLLVGIYSDLNGAPNSLLSSAVMNCTATGSSYQTSFTGTATLVKGRQYWIVSVRNNSTNPIVVNAEPNSGVVWVGGSSSVTQFPNQQGTLLLASSSNTLPATITQTNLSPSFKGPVTCGLKIA